ncbi:hypothetical protein AVEN_88133-1, partial [Araneus ventricosus]
MTTRFYARPLNSRNPPKGCFYYMRQLTIGASPAKDLSKIMVKNTPVSSKFQISEVALSGFPSQLSLSASLLITSLRKHLPSESRGVADELFLGDSSLSRTDKSPNRSRVLPSMVLIGSGQLLTGCLCRLHVCGPLKRYLTSLPGPLWACIRPGRFTTPFYDSYFPLRDAPSFRRGYE